MKITTMLQWKVLCACALVSVQYSDFVQANGNGWNSSPDNSGTATNDNYWWASMPSPFQKPANHPGVQRGVEQAPPAQANNYGNPGGSGWSSGNSNSGLGGGGQPPPSPSNQQVSNSYGSYDKPQSQPIPQNPYQNPSQNSNPGFETKPQPIPNQQSPPTNPYGSQPASQSQFQGSGWNAPSSNTNNNNNVPAPVQNYRPPQTDVECQLRNKADCHAGSTAPVINSGYNQVDSTSSNQLLQQQQQAPNPGYPSTSTYTQPQPPAPLQVPIQNENPYNSQINQSPVQIQPAPIPVPAPIPQVAQQPEPSKPSYQQPQSQPIVDSSYQQQQPLNSYTNSGPISSSYGNPIPSSPPAPPQQQKQPQNSYSNPNSYGNSIPSSPPQPQPQQIQPVKPAFQTNPYNNNVQQPAQNLIQTAPPSYQQQPLSSPVNTYNPQPSKPTYNPGQNYQPAPPQPSYNNNNNNDVLPPSPQCPAATLCTPDAQCDTNGVISESPLQLTEADKAYRVALMACSTPGTGVVGVCCRDPNYKDPWPNMNGGGGGDHQHHHQDKGQFNSGQYNPQQHQQPSNNVNSYSVRSISATHRPTTMTFTKCQPSEECIQSFNCVRGYIKSNVGNLAMDFDIRFNPKPKKCKEDFDGTYYVCCKRRQQPEIEQFVLTSYPTKYETTSTHVTSYQHQFFHQNLDYTSNNNNNGGTTKATTESIFIKNEKVQSNPFITTAELPATTSAPILIIASPKVPQNADKIKIHLTHKVISSNPNINEATTETNERRVTFNIESYNNNNHSFLSPSIDSETITESILIDSEAESDSGQIFRKQSLSFGLNHPESQQASGKIDKGIIAATTTPYKYFDNTEAPMEDNNQRLNTKQDAPVTTVYSHIDSQSEPFYSNEATTSINTNNQDYYYSQDTETELIQSLPQGKIIEIEKMGKLNYEIPTTTTRYSYNNAADDEITSYTQETTTSPSNVFSSSFTTIQPKTNVKSLEKDQHTNTNSHKIQTKDSSLYPFFHGVHRLNQYVISETGENIKVPSQYYEPPSLTPEDLLKLILPPDNDNVEDNNNPNKDEIQLFSPLAGNREKFVDECPANMKCLSDAYCSISNPNEGDLDAFDIRSQFKKKTQRLKCRQPNLPTDGYCCFLRDDFESMRQKHPQTTTNGENGSSIKKQKYDEERCGVRRPPYSIPQGTSATTFGEFPWSALILRNDMEEPCGGVILSKRIIATSSTCVQNARLDNIIIRVGEWNTQNNEEAKPHQDLTAKIILHHPGFKSINSNLAHDIALIITNEKIVFDYHVSRICIPEPIETNFEDQRCILAGWPSVAQNSSTPNIQEKVALGIISHNLCEKVIRNTIDERFSLHRTSLCTGNQPNVESCTAGQKGSPLVCESNTGTFTLVGLASWNKECNETPRVFTNIAMPVHTEWIYRVLGKDPDEFQ